MMNQKTLTIVGISVIAVLVILVVALPVSGAGKMGPQDGTGNQVGYHAYQNNAGQQGGSGSGSCIREDCPNNGNAPRDGTGMKYGQSGGGRCGNSGSGGQDCGHRFRG
ncbi:hypothetical protein [uncultured Methanospirillum sp.]|uniref:hypothetical protein n=1 Tax=uncultured Methanospirillum sp. TaxID=262503 RepID=UPI0029C92823|nr:hypothetical protein [uncultured Methanospirillum sp.]